ncbi:MAG: cell wall-active antibiotics response protein [Chloroflexota bacterium]
MSVFSLFNDIKRINRKGRLEGENITTIFGSVKVDFTRTPLEPGDHYVRLMSVFDKVKVRVPEDVGVDIDGFTIFGDVEVEHQGTGEEEKGGSNYTTDNFETARVRIHLTAHAIFEDIEVIRMPINQSTAVPRLETRTEEQEFDHVDTPYEGETRRLRRME